MTTDQAKTCPDCAEVIKTAANVCRFCGYRFDAKPPEPTGVKVKGVLGKAMSVAASGLESVRESERRHAASELERWEKASEEAAAAAPEAQSQANTQRLETLQSSHKAIRRDQEVAMRVLARIPAEERVLAVLQPDHRSPLIIIGETTSAIGYWVFKDFSKASKSQKALITRVAPTAQIGWSAHRARNFIDADQNQYLITGFPSDDIRDRPMYKVSLRNTAKLKRIFGPFVWR